MGYCVQLPGSLLPVKALSLSLSVLFFYKQRTEHSRFLSLLSRMYMTAMGCMFWP